METQINEDGRIIEKKPISKWVVVILVLGAVVLAGLYIWLQNGAFTTQTATDLTELKQRAEEIQQKGAALEEKFQTFEEKLGIKQADPLSPEDAVLVE